MHRAASRLVNGIFDLGPTSVSFEHYTILCHHLAEDFFDASVALLLPLLVLLVLDGTHLLEKLLLSSLYIYLLSCSLLFLMSRVVRNRVGWLVFVHKLEFLLGRDDWVNQAAMDLGTFIRFLELAEGELLIFIMLGHLCAVCVSFVIGGGTIEAIVLVLIGSLNIIHAVLRLLLLHHDKVTHALIVALSLLLLDVVLHVGRHLVEVELVNALGVAHMEQPLVSEQLVQRLLIVAVGLFLLKHHG